MQTWCQVGIKKMNRTCHFSDLDAKTREDRNQEAFKTAQDISRTHPKQAKTAVLLSRFYNIRITNRRMRS